jgi:hypothetical protein
MIMKSIFSSGRSGAAKIAPPKLELVILAEDTESECRAKQFSETLFVQVTDQCEGGANLWSFDALKISDVRYSAAEAARSADLVVVSVSGQHGLPPQMERWVELWKWLLDGANARLVALVEDSTANSADSICAVLRRLAEEKEFELFVEPTLKPSPELVDAERERQAVVNRWHKPYAKPVGSRGGTSPTDLGVFSYANAAAGLMA